MHPIDHTVPPHSHTDHLTGDPLDGAAMTADAFIAERVFNRFVEKPIILGEAQNVIMIQVFGP